MPPPSLPTLLRAFLAPKRQSHHRLIEGHKSIAIQQVSYLTFVNSDWMVGVALTVEVNVINWIVLLHPIIYVDHLLNRQVMKQQSPSDLES